MYYVMRILFNVAEVSGRMEIQDIEFPMEQRVEYKHVAKACEIAKEKMEKLGMRDFTYLLLPRTPYFYTYELRVWINYNKKENCIIHFY